MIVGGIYNWKFQPHRLIYLGKKGLWHQFKKIGDPRSVWCELLDRDLDMIEETVTLVFKRQGAPSPDRDT